MRVFHFVVILFTTSTILSAQSTIFFEKNFTWTTEEVKTLPTNDQFSFRPFAEDIYFDETNGLVPRVSHTFPVPQFGALRVRVLQVTFSDTIIKTSPELNLLLEEKLTFSTQVAQYKNTFKGIVSFSPALFDNGLKLISSIQLAIDFIPKNQSISRTPPKENSILRSGAYYQFQLAQTGIHKLSGKDLKNSGIDISSLRFSQIQLFGNEGGIIPQPNSAPRTDDLEEIPIMIADNGNDLFEEEDYILFFAMDADAYQFNFNTNYYKKATNPYDIYNYVYLKIDGNGPKTITETIPFNASYPEQNEILNIARWEENKINLLHESFGNEGSGLEWFGDVHSSINPTKDYTSKLNITNATPNSVAWLDFRFAGRTGSSRNVYVNIDDFETSSKINWVTLNNQIGTYASITEISKTFNLKNSNPQTKVFFDISGSSQIGYLDFIEIQYQSNSVLAGDQILIRSQKRNTTSRNLSIQNAANAEFWDVTNLHAPVRHDGRISGGSTSYSISDDGGKTYVCFNPNAELLKPKFIRQISNQNLHNISKANFLIITHDKLLQSAERLAEYRRSKNAWDVKVVTVDQIYNEFSSGRHDPAAIRDFIRMVYNRDPNLSHILLFGRGSFDYQGILFDKEKFNLVPVFESQNSTSPITSYPYDDFYCLLSPQEGGTFKGQVDLAIGRIPVSNNIDGNQMVDKIIRYETDKSLRGIWNLSSIFAADDEDSNLHVSQVEKVTSSVEKKEPAVNIDKIYFDAFKQESTPGGERYPLVKTIINNKVYNGALTFCYLGHGGPSGWAQERVLQTNDIDSWQNQRSLPLFITATCTFAPYDDPSTLSAGERVVLNKSGGISLFTTCRPVFASDNKRLTKAVFDTIFKKQNNRLQTLGEVLINAKNKNSDDTTGINARKFVLLGDPAITLLVPTLDVVTTHINEFDLTQGPFPDTIGALSAVRLRGEIHDKGVLRSDYNGTISIVFYDKKRKTKTLGQDKKSYELTFYERKNVLFRGNAKVENGKFDVSFYTPKDILFEYGTGKISYYATNYEEDASGYYYDFIVGGKGENQVKDDTPPIVQVFMNNEQFVSGGITNDHPVLYAKIEDDYGINLSGTAVGHDLLGTLDKNPQQTYVLNDFFETELNNFAKGTIQFPLNNLSEGKHTMHVKAWDIANNLGEGFVEFYVTNNPKEGLQHVLNYPNPFSEQTCFMFEHNLAGSTIDIQIDIFTVSGKLVKTIFHTDEGQGFRVNDIKWDGRDDYGQVLANGVYLYRVKAKSALSSEIKESVFEKLVLLK